jgi:hypothetical protein
VRFAFCLSLCLLASVAGAQHWVSDVPGNFIDISATGGTLLASSTTTPALGDDTEHNIVSTIGNAMFPAGNLRIGNNGAVANFGAAAAAGDVGLTNAAIVSGGTAVPAGLPAGTVCALAPFWDDLDVLTAGGSEIWWQEMGGMLAIMWKNVSHYPDSAGAVVTFEIIVHGNPVNPTDPRVQFAYQRSAFGGAHAAFDNAASATIGYVAGTLGGGLVNAQWSSNSASLIPGTVLTLIDGPTVPFGAVLSSPSGPGSVQIDILGSQFAFGGTYFMPVQVVQNGPAWFYGLAISLTDLFGQYTAGFPHVGPIGTTIGPIVGVPSGLTVYGTTVGWPAGVAPSVHVYGPAWAYTVP